MIFDCVIRSTGHEFSNLSPTVSESLVSVDDDAVFLLTPLLSVNTWIQMIVPSTRGTGTWLGNSLKKASIPLTALLANAARQRSGNCRPVTRTVLVDHFHYDLVLVLAPRALHQARIQNFLPAMQTLHVSAVLKEGSDSFPVFSLRDVRFSGLRYPILVNEPF